VERSSVETGLPDSVTSPRARTDRSWVPAGGSQDMDPGAGPLKPQVEPVVSWTEIVFDFLAVSVAVESVPVGFWRATASWRAQAVADWRGALAAYERASTLLRNLSSAMQLTPVEREAVQSIPESLRVCRSMLAPRP